MNFETIFWLILLVLYLVFQVVGTKKRPQRPPGPREPDLRPGGETDVDPGLDEALREIRDLLNPQPQRQSERPAPASAPAPAKVPDRAQTTTKLPEDDTSRIQKQAPRVFDVRQIPEQRRWQDTRLESTRKPRKQKKMKMGPIETLASDESLTGENYRHPLLAKLTSKKAAREAVILQELLGPPKLLRKRGTRL